MDVIDAEKLLAALEPGDDDLRSEVGVRDRVAYLKITTLSDPDDFAVVCTPGSRWYEVSVRGGYSAIHFDEEATDDEVATLVREYLALAVAYLRGNRTVVTSRVLRIPAVRVEAEGRPGRPQAVVGRRGQADLRAEAVNRTFAS
jgi:hypothetical protein